MVIVPSKREVTKPGRVFLRAPIFGTLATVDVDCAQAAGLGLMRARRENHNFVVRRAKRSEVVTFLTDHDAEILSC